MQLKRKKCLHLMIRLLVITQSLCLIIFLLAIKTIMNNEKKNVNICEILTKDSTTLIAFIIDKKAKIT